MGLRTAALSNRDLAIVPVKLLSSAQKKGREFERKTIRALTRLTQGRAGIEFYPFQWIRYRDLNGWGYAQPDAFIVGPEAILLYECKLTEQADTDEQMLRLYQPLLRRIWPDRPIVRIGVFRFLKTRPARPLEDPLGPLEAPQELFYTWHFPVGGMPGFKG